MHLLEHGRRDDCGRRRDVAPPARPRHHAAPEVPQGRRHRGVRRTGLVAASRRTLLRTREPALQQQHRRRPPQHRRHRHVRLPHRRSYRPGDVSRLVRMLGLVFLGGQFWGGIQMLNASRVPPPFPPPCALCFLASMFIVSIVCSPTLAIRCHGASGTAPSGAPRGSTRTPSLALHRFVGPRLVCLVCLVCLVWVTLNPRRRRGVPGRLRPVPELPVQESVRGCTTGSLARAWRARCGPRSTSLVHARTLLHMLALIDMAGNPTLGGGGVPPFGGGVASTFGSILFPFYFFLYPEYSDFLSFFLSSSGGAGRHRSCGGTVALMWTWAASPTRRI